MSSVPQPDPYSSLGPATASQHLRALARSWAVRQAVTLVGAEFLLGWWFAQASAEQGLFDASGHPNLYVVLAGLFYLLMRVSACLLVPALLAFVLVDHAGRSLFPPPLPPAPAPPAEDPQPRPG